MQARSSGLVNFLFLTLLNFDHAASKEATSMEFTPPVINVKVVFPVVPGKMI
jgi:hypothetical protein